MQSQIVETLYKIKLRLQRGWIKHYAAVDNIDRGCDPRSEAACKWCLSGALTAETPSGVLGTGIRQRIRALLDSNIPEGKQNRGFINYNDSSTLPEVLALLDRSIANCKE